jgi:hypothetical protein
MRYVLAGSTLAVIVFSAAVLGALTHAPAAEAHYGNIWFQTATWVAQAVEDKYDGVGAAYCGPIPAFARARYNAHSMIKNGQRMWDHVLCAVHSIATGNDCASVAHMMGQRWDQIMLTTWPRSGCGTRDLWG